MVQWFEGFDGQIVLDDDYVWILREDIPAELTRDTALPSLRAHRGAVVGTEFRPATATDLGVLRIRVSRRRDMERRPPGSDTVRFSLTSNDRFSTLDLLLAATVRDAIETVAPDDQLRAALDELDGIATQAELAVVLGESPDVTQRVDGVTWSSIGSLWVAAGGTSDEPADIRLERIRALQELTCGIPANAGIKTLQTIVRTTALCHLDSQRTGALWEAVMSEVRAPQSNSPSDGPSPTAIPGKRIPHPRSSPPEAQLRPRTSVWTKWDSRTDHDLEVEREVGGTVRSSEGRAELSGKLGPHAGAVQRDRTTAVSGRRIRVHLDCDGHRVKAVFDPVTGETEVTVAPVRALLGSVHPDPDAAARAVITAFRLGDDGPFDGWQLWRIDDNSDRPLAELPEAIPPV